VSTAALISLVCALIFTNLALSKARAKTRLSEALFDFMAVELFEQVNPNLSEDGDPTVRMVLDRASEKIENQFNSDPEIELKLRETLQSAYTSLWLPEEALAHGERVVELSNTIFGASDLRTMRTKHTLSTILLNLGRLEEAMVLCYEVLDVRKRKLGPDHPETLQIMNNLGGCLLRLGRLE
ncbi:unnamed protein product, partial [Laminaria digitata]